MADPIIADHRPYEVQGIPMNKTRSTRNAVELKCHDKDIGPKCAENECGTLLVCSGSATPLYHFNCADETSDKPYCVDNICTSIPSNSDNCKTSTNFHCNSEGTFPGIYFN